MTLLTNAQAAALKTAATIGNHNEAMGWVIDDAGHALGMMLTDLMVWARCQGVDFDFELASARDTFGDVYTDDEVEISSPGYAAASVGG